MVGTATPQEGTSSNRYTVLGRLASGGMADIFLARSTTESGIERYVVLKRVLRERSLDQNFIKMFLDEAKLASQLHHPNIAQVYDIGKLAGAYFFTMEYVHGEDIRALLHKLMGERLLPVNHALYIAAGTLAALHHAHERSSPDGKKLGVVHRDVSPANIMISYEGIVKLLDFGVAKAAQRSSETVTGTIKGKIAYLSPEQCQGFAVDRRSDVFSLGVVLHEMLTGRRLYRRDTDFATMIAIVQEPVLRPSAMRSDVTAEIDDIVMTALAKNPEHRFASASEMLEAIEAVATAERHVLTATSISRFLREIFGERPEPWIELRERGEDGKGLTITGESISAVSDLVPSPAAAIDVAVIEERKLETALHDAPALYRPDAELSPPPAAVKILPPRDPDETVTTAVVVADDLDDDDDELTGMPTSVAAPPTMPPPRTTPPPFPVPPRTTPPPFPVLSRTMTPNVAPSTVAPTTQMPAAAPTTPMPAVAPMPAPVAAPAMSVIVVPAAPPTPMPIAVGEVRPSAPIIGRPETVPPMPGEVRPSIIGRPETAPPGSTQSQQAYPDDAFVARPRSRLVVIGVAFTLTLAIAIIAVELTSSTPTPAPVAAAEAAVEPAVVATPDAAAIAKAADAAVAIDAAPVVVAPQPRTIGELAAAGEWAAALKACAARKLKQLALDDRATCGLAACNAKQRTAAVLYRDSLTGSRAAGVERACHDLGVSLAATHPAVDLCETDPLKCQK